MKPLQNKAALLLGIAWGTIPFAIKDHQGMVVLRRLEDSEKVVGLMEDASVFTGVPPDIAINRANGKCRLALIEERFQGILLLRIGNQDKKVLTHPRTPLAYRVARST